MEDYRDPAAIVALLDRAVSSDFRLTAAPGTEADWDNWSPAAILDAWQAAEAGRLAKLHERLAAASDELSYSFKQRRELEIDSAIATRGFAITRRLIQDVVEDVTFGLDYALELRRREPLVSPTRHAAVFFALISISGWDDVLERENHQYGYHFHHLSTRRGVVRTNVLLTFDPAEPVGPPDSLYWQEHGSYVPAHPHRWADRRRIAIHSVSSPTE